MGIVQFPPSSGESASAIKSVQRGLAGGAGNITISAVNTSKAFCTVFGTTSSGTVAASGSISGASGSASSQTGNQAATSLTRGNYKNSQASGYSGALDGIPASLRLPAAALSLNSQSISLNSTNLSGGSNNLVAATVQGFLADSTTLTVSGPCRWEVVEFN